MGKGFPHLLSCSAFVAVRLPFKEGKSKKEKEKQKKKKQNEKAKEKKKEKKKMDKKGRTKRRRGLKGVRVLPETGRIIDLSKKC